MCYLHIGTLFTAKTFYNQTKLQNMNQPNDALYSFFTNTKCKFTCNLGVEYIEDGGKCTMLFNLEHLHSIEIAQLGSNLVNNFIMFVSSWMYVDDEDLSNMISDSNLACNGNVPKWLHFVLGVNPEHIFKLPTSVFHGHISNALKNSNFCLFFRIYQDNVSKAEFTYNLSKRQITRHQGLEKLECDFDILDSLTHQDIDFFTHIIPNTWPY